MKSKILLASLLLVSPVCLRAQTTNDSASIPDYQVVQQDANTRVWQRQINETGPNGEVVPCIEKYTEIASGLNYFDSSSGQWQPASEQIDIQADGTAAAVHGQHQVYFPVDILNGNIEMVTPDGKQVKSQPAALAYDDGSNSVLIAVLTNSVGQVVGENQVIYTNAFSGINADLLYTYRKEGFEQDVILHESPPTPESLGLNQNSTRLEMLTEFLGSPAPVQCAQATVEENGVGMTDSTLDFGQMRMVQGKAFKLGEMNPSARVCKSWVTLGGRHFLVEQVPVLSLTNELDSLPAASAQVVSLAKTRLFAHALPLPPQHWAKNKDHSLKLARANLKWQRGVVLDYNTINTTLTNYTFLGGTTYYVSSSIHLMGTNIIEGGAIIKFTNSVSRYGASGITVSGAVIISTASPNHMAVLTSKDDNSVGETIPGSSGAPATIPSAYLELDYGPTIVPATNLAYLRFAYAATALKQISESTSYNQVCSLWNCQFLNCGTAIGLQDYNDANIIRQTLNNVLFTRCGTVVDNLNSMTYASEIGLVGQNLTVDQATNLLLTYTNDSYAVASPLTNSILTAVTYQVRQQNGYGGGNSPTLYSTNACYVAASASGVYETVGGGNYYLANNACRNVGTTNVNPVWLAELRQKTTYPPAALAGDLAVNTTLYPDVQRDTDVPDLGYHYDPIDYQGDSLTVESGTTLTLTNGVIVGVTGDNVTLNGSLIANVTMTNAEIQESQSSPLGVLIGGNAAAAYTDVDGNGLPDWWEVYYFGTNGLNPASDPDNDGSTLFADYVNGVDPNQNLGFTVNLGTRHFNTTSPTGTYVVLNAVPGYEAVLVNDTNLNDAVWQPYDGVVHLPLGPTDGAYQLLIGLKGFDPGASPAWVGDKVYLDRKSPTVYITNPTNSTTASPLIQIQGFADEALQGVTYDVSNALNVVTNQTGHLLGGQFFDTNLFEYTTDYFQCFDIGLTNGMNTISVHLTDLAGNVATTNVSVTLNYATATNPVVQLYWPQVNTMIMGTNFTWRGQVDDPMSQIMAQIVDTNGDTNIVTGIVGRDGNFWVENLPLNGGTNWLTLWVTNAAGLGSTTNFTVVQSSLNLAINPITDDLWLPTVTVSGTFSDFTDYTVWVNGVKATNTSGTSWTASNVPLPSGGVASIQARAIPNTNNGGNGTGGNEGGPVTYSNLGNPDPPTDQDAEADTDKPAEVVVDSANWTQTGYFDGTGNLYTDKEQYSSTKGGTDHYVWTFHYPGTGYLVYTADATYGPDYSFISETDNYHYVNYPEPDTNEVVTEGYPMAVPWEIGSQGPDAYGDSFNSQITLKLHTGGKGQSQSQNIFDLSASATELMTNVPYSLAIPPNQITVAGKALGLDGNLWTTYPDNASVDITPKAGASLYAFGMDSAGNYVGNVQAQKYIPTITANGIDVATSTPKFCVGQLVNFTLNGLPSAVVNMIGNWSLPGEFVNQSKNYSLSCLTYVENNTLLENTNQTPCWFVSGPSGPISAEMELIFNNGQSCSVSVNGQIGVYKPQVTWTGLNQGLISCDTSYNFPALHFGNSTKSGFLAELIATPYDNSQGTYSEIQLASSTSFENCNSNGQSIHGSASGADGPQTSIAMQNVGNYYGFYSDSPGAAYHSGDYRVSASGNYKTYLMLKPNSSGSIAVPIKLIGWNWNSVATIDTNGVWTCSPTSAPTPSPNNQDTSTFPVWTTNIYPYPAGYTIITNSTCE